MKIDIENICFRFNIFIEVIVPFIPWGNFKELFFIIIFLKIVFNIFCIFVWFFRNFIFPIIISPSLTSTPILIIPFFFKSLTDFKFVSGKTLVIIS